MPRRMTRFRADILSATRAREPRQNRILARLVASYAPAAPGLAPASSCFAKNLQNVKALSFASLFITMSKRQRFDQNGRKGWRG